MTGQPPEAGESRGALVIGGDYRALGVVRSLGRRGVDVWVVRSAEDHRLAGWSRFSQRCLTWPDDDAGRVEFLVDLSARTGGRRWTLFPTADATVAFVAREHAQLGEHFRLTTPGWDTFRWAYDKRLTGELAARLGVPHPRLVTPVDAAQAGRFEGPFPVILKPATKPRLNAPSAKAWRVEDRGELLRCYDAVAPLAEPGALMVQELIPGAGGQLSYAALCRQGEPVVSAIAERVRQYPMDFGRSSTYVRTIEDPEVERLGRRVLLALRLDGLVEVEFKRDPRDGQAKLLDINTRVWGWHTIGSGAGFDFAYSAWQLANGQPVPAQRLPAGLQWLRLTTDLPAALHELRQRRLSLTGYLRTVATPHARAVADWQDPFPGLLEVPMHLVGRLARLPPGAPLTRRYAAAGPAR